MKRETTKVCPFCGSTRLHLFTSMNYKRCSECKEGEKLPWHLAPGQKPLLGPSRTVK